MRIILGTMAALFLVVATLSGCASESSSDIVDLIKSPSKQAKEANKQSHRR